MKTFNKITISFTLLICLLFSYSLLYQVYLEQTGPIYDNTLRFHVRADSDKKEAQERKLIVRDAVLRYVKEDVIQSRLRTGIETESCRKNRRNRTGGSERFRREACPCLLYQRKISNTPLRNCYFPRRRISGTPGRYWQSCRT